MDPYKPAALYPTLPKPSDDAHPLSASPPAATAATAVADEQSLTADSPISPPLPSHSTKLVDNTGKYTVKCEGAFAAVQVAIRAGDGVKSQAGAMVTMSDNVELDTQLEGGFGASLLRCCCVDSTLFLTRYSLRTAQDAQQETDTEEEEEQQQQGPSLAGEGQGQPGDMGARGAWAHEQGDVLLAPPAPGEVVLLTLDEANPGWVVQRGGFLACDESVSVGVKMLGLAQGCCGGEGLFVMEARGRGRLLACSYGSVTRYDLAAGERRKIDNGYCVAWSSSMQWSIAPAARSSLLRSLASGEGLVACFTGPGTVFVQTRSLRNLGKVLAPHLPPMGGGAGSGGGGEDMG